MSDCEAALKMAEEAWRKERREYGGRGRGAVLEAICTCREQLDGVIMMWDVGGRHVHARAHRARASGSGGAVRGEGRADGRLMLDATPAGTTKTRKMTLGVAGYPKGGGRAQHGQRHRQMARVRVPVEHKEYGALRKPHGTEMCPAPIWMKRKRPNGENAVELERIMLQAEMKRVGPTRTCPFFTLFSAANGHLSRCTPNGGCYGRLAHRATNW